MYQHWKDKEPNSSSEIADVVIKMLEMFSGKKPVHRKTELIVLSKVTAPTTLPLKSGWILFVYGHVEISPLLVQPTTFIQYFLKSFPLQPPSLLPYRHRDFDEFHRYKA